MNETFKSWSRPKSMLEEMGTLSKHSRVELVGVVIDPYLDIAITEHGKI